MTSEDIKHQFIINELTRLRALTSSNSTQRRQETAPRSGSVTAVTPRVDDESERQTGNRRHQVVTSSPVPATEHTGLLAGVTDCSSEVTTPHRNTRKVRCQRRHGSSGVNWRKAKNKDDLKNWWSDDTINWQYVIEIDDWRMSTEKRRQMADDRVLQSEYTVWNFLE